MIPYAMGKLRCILPLTCIHLMRNSTARYSSRRRSMTPITEYKSFKLLLVISCVLSAHSQPQQGVFDFFKKFQETFLGVSSPSAETPLLSPKSKQASKLQRNTRTRGLTQRRALLEYTLHTHYGTFLGGKAPLNRQPRQRHRDSWTDQSTNCILYNEGNASFWTYYWCPNEHVKQISLRPKTLNNDGTVLEFQADKVIHLGNYQTTTNLKGMATSHSHNHGLAPIDSYDGGEECDILETGKLRGKKKRSTIVVFENGCDVNDDEQFRILSVVESQPCRYTIRACSKVPISVEVPEPDEQEVEEKSSFKQYLYEALDTYTKQSGLDAARMSTGDRISSLHIGLPPLPLSRKVANIKLIREMFIHAYDSYMYNAYPASELKPISCTPGTFDLVRLPALTLIDTLDTLVIMGNMTEFARATERLRDLDDSMKYGVDKKGNSYRIKDGGIFAQNQNVSVFETNIRVLGGLLSAHQMALAYLDNKVLEYDVKDDDGNIRFGELKQRISCSVNQGTIYEAENDDNPSDRDCMERCNCHNQTGTASSCESFWIYDGLLLELAHDMGRRLLPAFNTKTGIPYGTVNLLSGIPRGETPIASLAGGGTLNLEFELLSRLTGDESFGKAAKLASRALWMRRSNLNLLGKHLDVEKGDWAETLSGIGSNSDSFYEYMIKHYILFPEDSDFWPMFVATYNGVFNDTRLGEWYTDVDMHAGLKSGSSRRTFESLMAFYPGMQVLAGELSPAAKTLNSYFMVRETTGLLPERFNFAQWKVEGGGAGLHPLRPELLESCYFLHKSTAGTSAKRSASKPQNDEFDTDESGWLWAADYSLHTINRLSWTPCGFAIIKDVNPATTGAIPGPSQQTNRKIRTGNEMPSFFLSETLKYLFLAFDDNNILHKDEDREWVLTTEAHPIHHEPKKEPDFGVDSRLSDGPREELRILLHKRSSRQRSKSDSRDRVHFKNKTLFDSSEEEKWAIRTLASHYMNDIVETEAGLQVKIDAVYGKSMMFNFESHLQLTGLIGAFVTTEHIEKAELVPRETNMAGLALKGQGLETSITKGCPNVHSSSLLWMNALNGGVLDYGDVYVSSLSDEMPIDKRFAVGSLDAASALAFHGSGIFLGMAKLDEISSCSLADDTSVPLVPEPTEDAKGVSDGTLRFDLGGELGSFEVSVFADGNGFYVHHVNSGETIVTTVIADEAQAKKNVSPHVMVYSSTPNRPPKSVIVDADMDTKLSWRFSSGSWKATVLNQNGGTSAEVNDDSTSRIRRRVVVAANPMQSFACEVHLVQRHIISATSFINANENDDLVMEYEQIVSTFPCAPGLFGPTLISELVQSNGVTVEGPLHLPLAEDTTGCRMSENAVSYNPNDQPVQLVNRGDCTFEFKSMNQQKRNQAKAVIVVNNVNDEMFLMSKGTGSSQTGDDDSSHTPVSVLVTGIDGTYLAADMLKYAPVIAKVVVRPQRGRLENDSDGNLLIYQDKEHKLDWPVVKTNANAIQIFTSNGWGVHAVEKGRETDDDPSLSANSETDDATSTPPKDSGNLPNREWQLFLLQHSVNDMV